MPEQNGCHFADDIIKRIFLCDRFHILIEFSLKCVPSGLADNECKDWLKIWLGVVRQQAITWTDVDPQMELLLVIY